MKQENSLPTDASIITTYRCNMRCKMCNIWKNPSKVSQEIKPKELEILPNLNFINITGGEPFVRRDLSEIIEVAFKKSKRVVISTAGYHVEEILALAEKFPNIGIRVSLEGLSTINDHLRGRDGGFDRGLQTLLGLRKMGVKDIGFGITVSHKNSFDMLQLYELARNLKMEFATAAFHNSYYFHKEDNIINNHDQVSEHFYDLINRLLNTNNPKNWFRAFFNLGLINYLKGNKRFLPCEAGTVNFFIEPYGDVYPCNGLEERYWKESMGNIRDSDSFNQLWFSPRADKVKKLVKTCPKNCWMVGTAAPVMKKYLKHPLKWALIHKAQNAFGKKIDPSCMPVQYQVGQSPLQGDLRSPKIPIHAQKEEYPISNNVRFQTRVLKNEHLTEDVYLLRLERNEYQFKPGQSVSIGPHLKYHKGRDYTFCSGIDDDYLEFLIKAVKRGQISQYLKALKVGDQVDIVGPYGEFFILDPDDENRKHIFIASGVGLGPFICFIKSYPNLNYQVIHGIRYKKELVMANSLNLTRYISCITRDDGGDFRGRVTDYLKEQPISKEAAYYICGNPSMAWDVQEILIKKGVKQDRIFNEPYYAY